MISMLNLVNLLGESVRSQPSDGGPLEGLNLSGESFAGLLMQNGIDLQVPANEQELADLVASLPAEIGETLPLDSSAIAGATVALASLTVTGGVDTADTADTTDEPEELASLEMLPPQQPTDQVPLFAPPSHTEGVELPQSDSPIAQSIIAADTEPTVSDDSSIATPAVAPLPLLAYLMARAGQQAEPTELVSMPQSERAAAETIDDGAPLLLAETVAPADSAPPDSHSQTFALTPSIAQDKVLPSEPALTAADAETSTAVNAVSAGDRTLSLKPPAQPGNPPLLASSADNDLAPQTEAVAEELPAVVAPKKLADNNTPLAVPADLPITAKSPTDSSLASQQTTVAPAQQRVEWAAEPLLEESAVRAVGGQQPIAEGVKQNEIQSLQQESASRPTRLQNLGNALAERIQTMVAGELKRAVIRLDPPELGQVEVRIQVQQEQTQVQIITQTTPVRDALEQQSARLREALLEQGLNLAGLDVSDQSQQQSSSGATTTGESADSDDEAEETTVVESDYRAAGLVDQYV